MERWKKPPPPPPPPRPLRGYSCDHPSFSSTLLDAIYRSIDEPEGGGAAAAAKHPPPADAWRGATVRERGAAPRRTQPQTQPPPPPQQQQRRRGAYSTSSSSECSSYGGFSSSEPESAPGSARLKPIRTGSRPDPLHHHHPAAIQSPGLAQPLPAEKKKPSSIRSRIREFRRSSKAPASPGARLASFLNSIFAAAAGNPRKPSKRPPAAAAAADVAASCGESASACSTASSYSRSCLTKTPSTRGGLPPAPAPPQPPPLTAAAKRSVRFGPVSVIVDEERRRPCEKKLPYGGDPPPTARKRAEAMALGFGGEEEDEEDEEDEGESDASSDLFELESLAVAGDELPVYETTSFLTNRAIAHGLIV